jgi:uncharacterized protein involved in exopolysaccharide biosynthesis
MLGDGALGYAATQRPAFEAMMGIRVSREQRMSAGMSNGYDQALTRRRDPAPVARRRSNLLTPPSMNAFMSV